MKTRADFTLRKPAIVWPSTFWSAMSFFVSLCRVVSKGLSSSTSRAKSIPDSAAPEVSANYAISSA